MSKDEKKEINPIFADKLEVLKMLLMHIGSI